MGKLLNLAVYNPAILDDADFLAGFVARQDLAASLLARLGEITPRTQARHHLILGQRGMGKTSLLRRLALGVRENTALAAVLLPLTFREEQYNVHNLHTFWLNCLDALGDYFEKTGQADKADEIDRDIATLMRGDIDVEGAAALEVFKRWAKREGRRPLLLLDNIDFILDGLETQHWSLRRIMQEAGGIVVVGASAAYLEATADPKGAFYDFFQVTVLEKLGQDELIACLRRLAQERGEEGRKVLNVLNRDPGRIRTLHDLTGGNPRTLVLLYLLLELDAEGDVLSDLERLLDQVTVLYKSRVEDLAPQARVVLDAVALAWNPVTAADVAAATALDTSAVSTQLDRLQKNGVIEKVSLSSTARAGFQLGERFFNIWYLMRHGPRRQKTRLRWLTSFLRGFYSPAQLTEHSFELLKNSRHADECSIERGQLAWALSEAIDNKDLRHLLAQKARAEFEHVAAAEINPKYAYSWYSLSLLLRSQFPRYDEAVADIKKAIEGDSNDSRLWRNLGYLLLYHLDRPLEAEAAYLEAIRLKPDDNLVARSNLLVIYLIQPDYQSKADAEFDDIVARHPQNGQGLLNAIRALMRDNFGEATDALKKVFTDEQPDIFVFYQGFLITVLRLAAARGYGDKLLAWLDEQGYADRYWPLRAAFDAYLHGEGRLMDVNPEVRGAAKRIYDWLVSARRAQTAITEETGKAPRPKRKGVSRKTALPPAGATPAGSSDRRQSISE